MTSISETRPPGQGRHVERPRFHSEPEHDPVPTPSPSEPNQPAPDRDPPVFPEQDEVIFDEDEVAK